MEQEILSKTLIIFKNDFDKWNAFLELSSLRDKIINSWHMKLADELEERIELNDKWEFKKDIYNGLQWLIKNSGEDSFSIWLEKEYFSLWANSNLYDTELINSKLKEPRYQTIYDGILHKDIGFDGNYFIREAGRFEFNSIYDNNFDWNHLVWYAGNCTEQFVDQVVRKLQPFINNDTTELFIEINSLTKRKTKGR